MIFRKLKDQKCKSQFWFFFFTLYFKWNQSRCTDIDFNFQFSLLDENRMDERYTNRMPWPTPRFVYTPFSQAKLNSAIQPSLSVYIYFCKVEGTLIYFSVKMLQLSCTLDNSFCWRKEKEGCSSTYSCCLLVELYVVNFNITNYSVKCKNLVKPVELHYTVWGYCCYRWAYCRLLVLFRQAWIYLNNE